MKFTVAAQYWLFTSFPSIGHHYRCIFLGEMIGQVNELNNEHRVAIAKELVVAGDGFGVAAKDKVTVRKSADHDE